MADPGWNHDHAAGMHFQGCALCAAQSKSCRSTKNAEHFVRRAVVMSKRVDTGPPRTGPIVFGEALLYDGSEVRCVWSKCFAVE